jgi:drug/metabolite transporter (DMT)-like permease
MLYLALQVLSLAAFTQLLRWGTRRGESVMVVVWVNYAAAAAISIALWQFVHDGAMNGTAAALGLLSGALYFLNMLAILAAFKAAGVGVTSAVMSSAMVIPVLIAWFVWDDPMTPARWCALPAVWLALVLMRPASAPNERLKLFQKSDVVLLLPFLISGISGVVHKAASVHCAEFRPFYQSVLFTASTALSLAYALHLRLAHTRSAVGIGMMTGAANTGGTAFIVLALACLPATLFYPVSTALVIILNVAAARAFWGERILARQAAGMGLALTAVALMSFQ